MFSLLVAFEGVDSGKFDDFLVVERPLYKFSCPAKTQPTEEDL